MEPAELTLYANYMRGLRVAILQHNPATWSTLAQLANHYDAFLFDGFGTLYNLSVAHPGAPEQLRSLRFQHKQIRLVTNAASRHPRLLVRHLHSLGFDFTPDEIICSGSLLGPANERLQIKSALHVGRAEALCFLKAAGIEAQDSPHEATVILSSAPQDWQSPQVMHAEQILQRPHARLIVLNPDAYAPRVDGTRVRVSGMLAWELHQKTACELICLGKPFGEIFACALQSLGLQANQCLMVGDTLGTDIVGAQAVGIDTALVLGGNTRSESLAQDEAALGVVPNYYLASTY